MSEFASTSPNVVDLTAYRTARRIWQSEEDAGRLLFLELRAEARATITALAAEGVL